MLPLHPPHAMCRPTQPRNYKWSASSCWALSLRQQWEWLLGPDMGGLSVQQLSSALPKRHRKNEVTSVGWKSNNLARPYPNDLQYWLHRREWRKKTLSSCKAVNRDGGGEMEAQLIFESQQPQGQLHIKHLLQNFVHQRGEKHLKQRGDRDFEASIRNMNNKKQWLQAYIIMHTWGVMIKMSHLNQHHLTASCRVQC